MPWASLFLQVSNLWASHRVNLVNHFEGPMMKKHLWMSMCVAAALAGCAADGQAQRHGGGPTYSGSYDNPAADGGPITVVIDGRTYKGPAQRIQTNTGALVYQALLSTPNGPALRCQLVDEGRRRLSGTCTDENQRTFEVRVGH